MSSSQSVNSGDIKFRVNSGDIILNSPGVHEKGHSPIPLQTIDACRPLTFITVCDTRGKLEARD